MLLRATDKRPASDSTQGEDCDYDELHTTNYNLNVEVVKPNVEVHW